MQESSWAGCIKEEGERIRDVSVAQLHGIHTPTTSTPRLTSGTIYYSEDSRGLKSSSTIFMINGTDVDDRYLSAQ